MADRPAAWHGYEVEEALEALDSSPDGLAPEEARRRLERYGPNRLDRAKRRGPWLRFLAQFDNVLIYVLLGAAAVTAAMGHWIDTAVIVGVVVINAVIGFIQEGKAEKAMEAIRDMLAPQATVVRGGKRATLPAEDLVPGDVVELKSGDKVPADLRLIKTRNIQVQEAALTGESMPVEKDVAPVGESTELADRTSMAYAGTLVAYGKAMGLVVATGRDTELGRISTMISEVEELTTPLLKSMAVFARWLTAAILALAVLSFAFGTLFRDFGAQEMFLAAVSLAVAAIPEGLPAILTITLAIGVTRMARRNAIIRRLPAVETLGSVTVICTDKTGTLTRNELSVQRLITADRAFEVTGTGYGPSGSFHFDGEKVDPAGEPVLEAAILAAIRCNDAELREEEGEWRLFGNPTDGALMTLGVKAKKDIKFEHQACPRTDVIPFESEHKFMATLHHDHEGNRLIYVKGAPERILKMCARQQASDGEVALDRDFWEDQVAELADAGMRVLAVAYRPTDGQHLTLSFRDVEGELTMLAVFGIIDLPRDEAITAVADCRAAGIVVKMITGDHAATARAIGAELGIGENGRVLTGGELAEMDDGALTEAVESVDIYARTTPEQKLRLVSALQKRQQVVAMTGDGVNDAPALKRADVGIAMGRKGTEAAKEASEMVLADDNFASIAHAVEEGRTVYDNIKKAILFILPTNGGQALVILTAVALGLTLPVTPVQILWVNMVSAVTLALALAFEKAEADIMRRPPRRPGEPLLSGYLLWRLLLVSVLLLAAALGMFLWLLEQGRPIEQARTAAVNAIVVGEIAYLINARYLRAPCWNLEGFFGSRPVLIAIVLVLVLQAFFTYAGPMQLLFGSAGLGALEWVVIWICGAAIFLLVELEKLVLRWRRPMPEATGNKTDRVAKGA